MFSLTREPNVAISLNEYHRWQIQFLRWILLYIGTKLIFAKKCWIFKYNIHHQNSLNAHSIWYTVSNSLYLTLFKDNGGKADILRQMDPINSNQLIQPNPFMKQSHDHEPSIANHRQEEVQYIQAPSIHRKLIHNSSLSQTEPFPCISYTCNVCGQKNFDSQNALFTLIVALKRSIFLRSRRLYHIWHSIYHISYAVYDVDYII